MLPRVSIEEFLYEGGRRASAGLEQIIGVDDPTVYHLALVLLSSFARAGGCNKSFVKQAILVLLTHVQDRFVPTQVPVCTGKGLTPWQLRRAKELIAGYLAEDVSVAHLAEECGLSCGYFTKALKCNTDVSPHKWLIRICVDWAKESMSGSDEPLSQIDVACDFPGQPHFSRILLRPAGTPPST